MAGVQLSGLSSGLDTASIVESLIAVEKVPRQRIAYQQVNAEARRTGLNDIQTKLATLKSAASDLASVLTWSDTQSVTVADEKKIAAARTGGVGPGTYNFVVTQMASAARNTYAYGTPPADVEMTISSGTSSKTLTVPAGATLDEMVAQINADSETGVFAVKVGSDIVLASRTTGVASAITLDVTGTGVIPPTSTVAGRDAQYTVDGGAVQTSGANTITNAIPGLDVTFKGLTDGAGVAVTVGGPAPDTTALKTKLKAFVTAYNDAQSLMKTKYDEQVVRNPTNNVDAAKGALKSDSTLGAVLAAMRGAVSSEVTGADSALNLLSQIGVSTGASTGSGILDKDAIAGKLKFDEAAFDAAYASNPTKVRQLLGGSGDAFGQSFASMIDTYSSATGVLKERMTQSDAAIQAVKDGLDRFDKRLTARQSYLEKQFAAMESAMSKSKSLSSYLSAQIANLSA